MRDLLRNPQHHSVMMAYGITAAGKTYTIEGTREAPGVMPRALLALFEGLATHVEPLAARVSYYEVGGRGGTGGGGARGQSVRVMGGGGGGPYHCPLSPSTRSQKYRHDLTDACALLPLVLLLPVRLLASLLQVYNEQIYDLLDEQGVGPLGQRGVLKLKEDARGRVFVAGLSEVRRAGGQGKGRGVVRVCLCVVGRSLCSLASACPSSRTPPPPACAGGRGQRRGVPGGAQTRVAPAPARRDRAQLQLLALALHLHGVWGGRWRGGWGGRGTEAGGRGDRRGAVGGRDSVRPAGWAVGVARQMSVLRLSLLRHPAF